MALIVITLFDNAHGDADIAVQCEPKLDLDPKAILTAAQLAALNMLHAIESKEKRLIQLLN